MRFPRTRGYCLGGPRPCPWVGCRYHLLADVTRTGTIRFSVGGTREDPELAAREGRTYARTLTRHPAGIRAKYGDAHERVDDKVAVLLRHLSADRPTCALDVADQGAHTLEQIADLYGVTREAIHQIEQRALAKLQTSELAVVRAFDDAGQTAGVE